MGVHRRGPGQGQRYKRARGKGGFVRAEWGEAAEIAAAAHVYTIKQYGPDRVAGFSPIPAMSMVSHATGARFISLIGGTMLSFYDWYADLPVASPQVFGDQTDVPESADWLDAGYLIMWGSNVPVTRTPDAHYMTEARYRGQKVVVVSPDYADNTKFADEWVAARPGTDAALAMSMGHVVLKEFFIEKQTPMFTDYIKSFTDLPYLSASTRRRIRTALCRASSSPPRISATPAKASSTSRCCSTRRATPSCPTARWAIASARATRASGTSTSRVSTRCSPCSAIPTRARRPSRCRVSTPMSPGRSSAVCRRRSSRANGSPPSSTCCSRSTAWAATGLPGEWAKGLRRHRVAVHPGLAGNITGVPAVQAAERIGREFADNADVPAVAR